MTPPGTQLGKGHTGAFSPETPDTRSPPGRGDGDCYSGAVLTDLKDSILRHLDVGPLLAHLKADFSRSQQNVSVAATGCRGGLMKRL